MTTKSRFSLNVSFYMNQPVLTVRGDESLESVSEKMAGSKVSSFAVLDGKKFVGVITRTDLLHQAHAGESQGLRQLFTFPNKTASDIMSTELLTIGPGESLEKAAQMMVGRKCHRIYVTQNDAPVGVLSTRDLMVSIRDRRVDRPLYEVMSRPVFTIRAHETIATAGERLERAHVTGLIVTDGRWPVGVFTQSVALEARHLPQQTPVEQVMSSAFLALDENTPLFRAAAQAAAMEVRRVIVVKEGEPEGILTGIDFAKVVGGH